MIKMQRILNEKEVCKDIYNLDVKIIDFETNLDNILSKSKKEKLYFLAKEFFGGKNKNYIEKYSGNFYLFPGFKPEEEYLELKLGLDNFDNRCTLDRLEVMLKWDKSIENPIDLHLNFLKYDVNIDNNVNYRVFIKPDDYVKELREKLMGKLCGVLNEEVIKQGYSLIL